MDGERLEEEESGCSTSRQGGSNSGMGGSKQKGVWDSRYSDKNSRYVQTSRNE